MMAGFAHVPVGDLDALHAAIDEQTACILLSPVDLLGAARPIDAGYLEGVRELCDEHEILLVIDETQLAAALQWCGPVSIAFNANPMHVYIGGGSNPFSGIQLLGRMV